MKMHLKSICSEREFRQGYRHAIVDVVFEDCSLPRCFVVPDFPVFLRLTEIPLLL